MTIHELRELAKRLRLRAAGARPLSVFDGKANEQTVGEVSDLEEAARLIDQMADVWPRKEVIR